MILPAKSMADVKLRRNFRRGLRCLERQSDSPVIAAKQINISMGKIILSLLTIKESDVMSPASAKPIAT